MAHIALPLPRRVPGLSLRHRSDGGVAPSALAVGWIGMALLFATTALSVYLVQISAVANAGYDLQRLEAERKGWLARNEQLELELAKRRSLAWVESQAAQHLGMVRAQKPVYLQVDMPHEREAAEAEIAAGGPTTNSGRQPSGRPEPGNPAWAIDTMRAWLGLVAGR